MTNKEFKVGCTYSDKRGNKWKITADNGIGIFSLNAQCIDDINDAGLDYEEFQPDGSYTLEDASDFDLIWSEQSDNALLEFKRKCKDFGVIAGKSGVPSEDDLRNQVRLITEEAKELKDTFEMGEPLINTLQELTDVLVVGFGLLEMFRKLNYDVDGALLAVADCNLSKFTNDEIVALNTEAKYLEQGVAVELAYNAEHNVWVIKDENDKVRKPLNFKKVNLEEFKPKC